MADGHSRFSLVVASQCEAMGQELKLLARAARELDTMLRDPRRGECSAALPNGHSLLLNQDAGTTMTAVADASEKARNGLLILAWIGHGMVRNDDFYVLPSGSDPARLGFPQGGPYHLPHQLKELLTARPCLSMILLIDACMAGAGAVQAATEWMGLDNDLRRRFQILSATNMNEAAYDCAFSRAISTLLRTGHIALDDHLVCGDLKRASERATRVQQPSLFALDGAKDGPDLWVAHNAARLHQTGSLPAFQLADGWEGLRRSLRHFYPTPSLETIVAASRTHRSVVVRGLAGFGKTTLMGALTRSEVAPGVVPDSFVHALRLLKRYETSGRVAEAISDQLSVTVPSFPRAKQAFENSVPSSEREQMPMADQHLLKPLRHLPAHTVVRIVFDGFDQLDEVPARDLGDLLQRLQQPWQEGADVRVVVSSRPDAAPPLAECEILVDVAPESELRAYLTERCVPQQLCEEVLAGSDGSWLVASLLADHVRDTPGLLPHEIPSGLAAVYRGIFDHALDGGAIWDKAGSPVKAAFTVLTAAGPGAVLPEPLLLDASARLSAPTLGEGRLQECLEPLRRYVARAPASQNTSSTMLYGLFHQSVADYLTGTLKGGPSSYRVDATAGHRALAEAIASLAPADERTPDNAREPLQDYAERAEPDHLWRCGSYEQVLRSLETRPSVIPAENLERWERWHHEFADHFGSDHPYTLTAQHEVADNTGAKGELGRAVEMFTTLLPVRMRVLGPDHPATLTTRGSLAHWTALNGQVADALELFTRLLRDCTRVLGHDHPDTLTARHDIAALIGMKGEPNHALELLTELLPERLKVLGPDHWDTLATRHEIASWTARSGNPERAVEILSELVPDYTRALGPDHPNTLIARGSYAAWTSKSGHHQRALKLLTELLLDRMSVLGPDNPETLVTRYNIAAVTYELGDCEKAVTLWREVLPDFVRVLGGDHPRTQVVRQRLDGTGHDGGAGPTGPSVK
ncbi:tetratricopeptide repeat protein [Streptomyces sp. NPDC021080]|uniref:tetratricopeptide repeat protein n=1 Tax=Streptomyces sp. NPDC021080 TaxID=3365110 RepID=UPI0037A4A9FB